MASKELMQERKILVYNQPRQKYYTFSTATDKWSDIVELIKGCRDLEVSDISAMRAVVASTQNTLELPNALIPEGDQKIFLFEAKVKSGAKNTTDYETMSYNDLRRLTRDKGVSDGLGANPRKEDLISRLEKSAGVSKTKVQTPTSTGKTRNKTIVEKSENTDNLIQKDKEHLKETNISQEERIAALEQGFSKLIKGLYELCSDFVKKPEPKEAPKKETHSSSIPDDIDVSDLAREAKGLQLK